MAEAKVKAAKVKIVPPPDPKSADGRFHVYVFDVFHKEFLPGKTFDTIERAVQYQRQAQEHIYLEQEADPALFDLPFISSDPGLLERVRSDAAFRTALVRDLTSDARGRARRR